jgi:2-methylfumaryl-CoA isomerase
MYSLLKGVRVIEGAAFIAAPMAGMSLAQLGADVIRFDPIGGGIDYRRMPLARSGGRSLYWAGLNKCKRSLAVDLNRPEGRELVLRLVAGAGAKAGILLTNFSGVKWLEYAELRRRRADVIKLEISGNHDGTTALDYTVNCALGYPYVTGTGNREAPVNHVLPAWDVACALQAALGISAALLHRAETGQGQHIKLALSDVALSVVGSLGHVAEAQLNGEERQPVGNHVYGAIGRDFATRDGRRICIVAVSYKQWQTLCEAMDLVQSMGELEASLGLDFRLEEHRFAAREPVCARIAVWCAGRDFNALVRLLDEKRVCWGPYQSFMELVSSDPRLSRQNPMFSEVEHPGVGRHLTAGSPLSFAGEPRLPSGAAPLVGQHTEEILADVLGLAGAEIGRLMDAGIVAGAEAEHG